MLNYFIVGGSYGIGKSLSQLLANENNVFSTYNKNETSLEGIKYFHYDVSSELDLSKLPDTIDGFCYCPRSINLKPFSRITEEMFIKDYKLQVTGAVKTLQTILPKLKLSENASVVFFSTVAVQTGIAFHSLVSASKGAIEGLTKALAAELVPKIRVNCISTIVNTNSIRKLNIKYTRKN